MDRSYRKLVKKIFFQLINAQPEQRIRPPSRDQFPPDWSFEDVERALREKHEAIADYFRSGIGIELQTVDADIAIRILHRAMAEGELVLPIHDSFISMKPYGDRLQHLMLTAYEEEMAARIGLKLDPPFPVEPMIRYFGIAPAERDRIDPAVIEERESRLAGQFESRNFEGYRSGVMAFRERQSDEYRERYRGPPAGY